MNCAEVDQNRELHVVGALPWDTAEDLEAHLADCPSCREAVSRSWEMAKMLRLAVPATDPPESLRRRVLAAASADTAAEPDPQIPSSPRLPVSPSHRSPVSPSSRRFSVPHLSPRLTWAAAAATLPLMLSGWLAFQVTALQQEVHSVAQASARSQTTNEMTAEVFLKGMASGGAWAAVNGAEMAPAARGRLYYVLNDGGEAVLFCEGLPPLPRDQAYQVWLMRGQERLSAGMIYPEEGAKLVLVIRAPLPVGEFDAVGVTSEPRRGSAEPSSSNYLWGRVKRS